MWNLKDVILNIGIFDILDITIVAYIFYKLYMLIKETRAEQLIKGIIVLLVATKASELLQFHVVNWILRNTMTVGLIALLIVFQPELRRALEYIGRTKLLDISSYDEEVDDIIDEIIEALFSLSRQKIGALIVFEKETGINDIVQTGTRINGKITRQLLINIFIPNTPLHDGAVIIKENRIKAAGCFLPLSENKYLSKELGTRHRSAIGISENSDAISLTVSEETGQISIADNGKLYKDVSKGYIKNTLEKIYNKKDKESKNIFNKGNIFSKGRFFK
ncbi:MAG: diadenylate cyclase CdaA [Peptostreptococcaceae bacterium]|nr:diadenylate cyclase CdaA [Peptostreptococcaceae bacterium]